MIYYTPVYHDVSCKSLAISLMETFEITGKITRTFEITRKINPFPLSPFYQVFGHSKNKTKTLQGISDCERLKYLGKDGVTRLKVLCLLKDDIGQGISPVLRCCSGVA